MNKIDDKSPEEIAATRDWIGKFGKAETNETILKSVINAVRKSSKETRNRFRELGIEIPKEKEGEFHQTTYPAFAAALEVAALQGQRIFMERALAAMPRQEVEKTESVADLWTKYTQANMEATKTPMSEIQSVVDEAVKIASEYPNMRKVEKIPSYSESCTLRDGRIVLMLGEEHGNNDSIADLGVLIQELTHAKPEEVVFLLESIHCPRLEEYRHCRMSYPPTAIITAVDIAKQTGIAMEHAILPASSKQTFRDACLHMDEWMNINIPKKKKRIQPQDVVVFIARARGGAIAERNGFTGEIARQAYLMEMETVLQKLELIMDDAMKDALRNVQAQQFLDQAPDGGKATAENEPIGWRILKEASDRVTEPHLETLLQKHAEKKYLLAVAGQSHIDSIKKVIDRYR